MKMRKYLNHQRETVILHAVFKNYLKILVWNQYETLISNVLLKGTLRMCCSYIWLYSGLRQCTVVWWLGASISEERTVSELILKLEIVYSFSTLVPAYWTACCHNPKDHNININCCVNLKSYTVQHNFKIVQNKTGGSILFLTWFICWLMNVTNVHPCKIWGYHNVEHEGILRCDVA
jgi:hypothetical protein